MITRYMLAKLEKSTITVKGVELPFLFNSLQLGLQVFGGKLAAVVAIDDNMLVKVTQVGDYTTFQLAILNLAPHKPGTAGSYLEVGHMFSKKAFLSEIETLKEECVKFVEAYFCNPEMITKGEDLEFTLEKTIFDLDAYYNNEDDARWVNVPVSVLKAERKKGRMVSF